MLKNALLISFAFIGTVVGAGFASGQEAMLYFSAFGTQGLWGAVLGSALMLIAGVTILLGLPIGRLRRPMPGLRVFLNATAVGVLIFLVWDVLSAAWEPIDSALAELHAGTGSFRPIAGYGLLFASGLSIGLLGLVAYEGWMRRRATMAFQRFGPGAASASELDTRRVGIAGWSPARQLALLIAM